MQLTGHDMAEVIAFKGKRPDPRCAECGGKGWHTQRYYAPGNSVVQQIVVICDCMKEKAR